MTKFVLVYRMPEDYQPGNRDTMKTWQDWFDGLGDSLVTAGNPVFHASTIGKTDAHSVLGGYSIVTAPNMDAARHIASGCPALTDGCGVEIGVLTELH